MFAERNGIKSLWRTPLRSILFFLLILLLSSILTLSSVLFSAIETFLKECRESYRTTAVLEYLGKQYPEAKVYDKVLEEEIRSGALDIGKLRALPEVLSYEDGYAELGLTDAKRLDKYVYDRGLGVIVIDSLMWDKNGETYMAVIRDVLYSQRDHKGKLVFIDPGAFPGVDIQSCLQKGNSYILSGHYIDGTSSYLWFSPEDQTFLLNGEEHTVKGWSLYEEDGDYQDYKDTAEIFRIQNSSFRLVYTSSVEDLQPFSEEELSLSEGRFFTPEEKENGNAAIISDRAAAFLEKGIGEEICFRLYDGTDGLYTITSLEPKGEKTVTIRGIYASTENYPDWVFLSEAHEADNSFVPTGYNLGQFRIDNDGADSFYKSAKDLLPRNFRLTVYDQGYRLTAGPYKELLLAVGFFFVLALLLTVALLFLYGFLLVMKDKNSVETMEMLGTGKLFVFRYFLSQTTLLALLSSLLGAVLAGRMEGRAKALIRSFSSFRNQNLQYSQSLLGTIKVLEFNPETPLSVFIFSILLVLFFAVLAVLYFLRKAFRKKAPKKKKRTVRLKELKGSVLYGRYKYPFLSIRRNVLKTLSVSLVLLASFLFIGILHGLEVRYEEKKREVMASTVLTGYASSITGLDYDKLVVPVRNIQSLQEEALVSSLDYGRTVGNYRIVGIRQKADGTLLPLEKPYIPETSFAMETFLSQLAKEPEWISVSDVRHVPEFFYSGKNEVDFLEGYDYDSFSSRQADICLLPESMGERLGLEKGDVIRILTYMQNGQVRGLPLYDLLVVGFFRSEGVVENLYSPFDFSLFGEEKAEGKPWPNAVETRFETGRANGYLAAESSLVPELVETAECYFTSFGPERVLEYGSDTCLVESSFLRSYLGTSAYNRYRQNPSSSRYLTVTFEDGSSGRFLIIGEFEGDGDAKVFYSPYNTTYQSFHGFYDYDLSVGSPFSLRYAFFSLDDVEKLDELRASLENAEFVHPGSHGKIRNYAVIEDREYLSTISSFDREIQYLKVLNAFLFTALFSVSFVLSFLLIGGRREEVGIMRSLGTQRWIIFWSFVGEQLLLVLLLFLFSTGGNVLLWGMESTVLILSLAFSALWLLGATVKMIQMLKTDIRDFYTGEE